MGLLPDDAGYYEQHKRRYADTLSLLPDPAPGDQLLDIGILPGHLASLAGRRGYKISGTSNVDLNAETRARAEALGLSVAKGDIERDPLPFDDDTFEVVTFCEVIEHLYMNPFCALKEIFRVLKPAGRLIMTTPNLGSVEKIAALIRGNSYKSSIRSPLNINFQPIVSFTHFREYTARELLFMLRWQDKEAYRFVPEKLIFSDCWQPTPKEIAGQCRREPLRGLAASMLWLARSLAPRLRSCIMIRAMKPVDAAWVEPEAVTFVKGVGNVEHDQAPADRSRMALPAPFRWTDGNAVIAFANPSPGKIGSLCLRVALIAPPGVGNIPIRILLNGRRALETSLKPGSEYVCLEIPVPEQVRGEKLLELVLESGTWKPVDFGLSDDRELGIMLAQERILLLPELPTPERLERMGRKVPAIP